MNPLAHQLRPPQDQALGWYKSKKTNLSPLQIWPHCCPLLFDFKSGVGFGIWSEGYHLKQAQEIRVALHTGKQQINIYCPQREFEGEFAVKG